MLINEDELKRTFACHHMAPLCGNCKELNYLDWLPKKVVPVDQLTEREKVGLALAAGANWRSEFVGGTFKVITAPVGIVIGVDGKYVVAVNNHAKGW